MNRAEISFNRISNIIQSDKKLATSDAVAEILKSDIVNSVKNYFNIIENTAFVQIDVKNQNDIDIFFTIKASRIKDFFASEL